MIVCPLCEHAQPQGTECDVCGKPFGRAGIPVPVPPLDGLETTHHAAAPAPAPERIPELEPTGHAVAPLTRDLVPDLEHHAVPAVHVVAEAMGDLERTAAEPIPGDGPTPVATAVVCRYCRTPAAGDERVCTRCGMRLPRLAGATAGAAGAAPPRRCSCGSDLRGPGLCPVCGARSSAS